MFNIAIDGNGGSGKSTLSKGLADKLKFKVLDTGAIYRSAACAFEDRGYKKIDEKNIKLFCSEIDIEIKFVGKTQIVLVNGIDYSNRIRSEEISVLTAKISPFTQLRKKIRLLQRDFADKNDCVIEGRDIGSEVLPGADVKLFITASPEIRAKRRYDQIKNKPNAPSFEEVLADLNQRDYLDTNRAVSPLKPANDAFIIDTTNMTLQESIEYCEKIVKAKMREKKNMAK